MSAIQVAGIQLDIEWEAPAENRRRAERWITAAVAGGARLVALPEMFATGFSMAAEAMAAHAAETEDWVCEAARRHGAWIIAGLATPNPGGRPKNTALVVDPNGKVHARYHKIHPFSLAREHEHFDAGTGVETVLIEGVRVTPLICYDLRFAELFRETAQRTDLFVVIANWPTPRRGHWQTLLHARAIENQAYVLGVNRVGEGGRLKYSGDSALHDPLGEAIARSSVREGLVTGIVKSEEIAAVRAKFSFLADRRPEVYEGLASKPRQIQ